MQLSFQPSPLLPKLAWIAQVDTANQQASVRHGVWVETLAQGFIEGLWDGAFAQADFDRSACVFGSGAVVRGQALVFVPSTSTTDYLYWWASEDRQVVVVANSLPLLLAIQDDALDPQQPQYGDINRSVMRGIQHYTPEIPTKKGSVQRLMHWNLHVAHGRVMLIDKPSPPPFSDFKAYVAYLHQAYARLAANARDACRARPLAIFSTQSKGYDSTAANAVAKTQGVDRAFTVTKSKGKGYFAHEDHGHELDDDGRAICQFFQIDCQPIERRALEQQSAQEYLFYACMHETGDFNLLQIGEQVQQPTVLITGCLGELWQTAPYHQAHPGLVNANLIRGDLGNHALTEVRLEAGYVQLAFPYIGARSRADILKITESEEMAPWRLNNAYDRPIPRRLAEETGLGRAEFGQVKMASVLEYPSPVTPVGAALRRDYLVFLVQHGLLSGLGVRLLPLAQRWNALIGTTSPRRHVWNYYLQRLLSKLSGRPFTFPTVLGRLNGAIFCFCVNKRITDYQRALSTPQIQSP
jgi:hypothetical protein